MHSQWRWHSRSLALSFEVPLRYYLRCLALLLEVLYCAAIRGRLRTKSKTKIFKFRRFFFFPSDQNEQYHTPLLSKIWDLSDRNKLWDSPFNFHELHLSPTKLPHSRFYSLISDDHKSFNCQCLPVFACISFIFADDFACISFIFADDRIFWRDEQMNTAWEVKIINMINLSNNQFNLISDADEKNNNVFTFLNWVRMKRMWYIYRHWKKFSKQILEIGFRGCRKRTSYHFKRGFIIFF